MAKTASPKYIDLMNWIREQIASGEFAVGMRLPSENEMGIKFSISRQTVRQATSILESEGLLERRRGSGTYIAATKSATPKNFSRNIGVVLTYSNEYIFPEIVKGIEEVLTRNGYFMQLAFTYNRVEKEAYILDIMLKSNIDALIIEPAKSGIPFINTDFYQKIKSRGIPCIFIHAETNPPMNIPSVRLDDYLLGRAAATCLIEHGHRNIAGIFKADDMQGQLRYSGAISGLRKYSLLASEKRMFWYTTESLQAIEKGEFDRQILERFGSATAIICYNDQMAKHIISLLQRAGKSVPEDISVIGVDDLDFESPVGLTTFAHPKKEMGKTVAKQLLKLMENPNLNVSIKFPPELVERDSVKSL